MNKQDLIEYLKSQYFKRITNDDMIFNGNTKCYVYSVTRYEIHVKTDFLSFFFNFKKHPFSYEESCICAIGHQLCTSNDNIFDYLKLVVTKQKTEEEIINSIK